MDGIETESEGIQTDEEFEKDTQRPADNENISSNESDVPISEKLKKLPIKLAEEQFDGQSAETSPQEIENVLVNENETEKDSSLLEPREIVDPENENEMHTEEVENLIQNSSGFEPLMETIQEIDSDNVPDMIPDSSETDSKPESDNEFSKIENETAAEKVTYAEIQDDSGSEFLTRIKSNAREERRVDQEHSEVEKIEPETVADLVTEKESSSLTQKLMNFMEFADDVKVNLTPPNTNSEIQPRLVTVSEEITYREVTQQEADLLKSILESQSNR